MTPLKIAYLSTNGQEIGPLVAAFTVAGRASEASTAFQNIAGRLPEAIERGMRDAADEMKRELQDIYLDIEGTRDGAIMHH